VFKLLCVVFSTGGLPQPGPIFQALPEPAPLPPLPMPEMPAEAMTPGMAPETAPAGLPQPGTSFQVFFHFRFSHPKHDQGPGVWSLSVMACRIGNMSIGRFPVENKNVFLDEVVPEATV
jgi:hypothetical protein